MKQQIRGVGPMLGWRWVTIYDASLTAAQHWANASFFGESLQTYNTHIFEYLKLGRSHVRVHPSMRPQLIWIYYCYRLGRIAGSTSRSLRKGTQWHLRLFMCNMSVIYQDVLVICKCMSQHLNRPWYRTKSRSKYSYHKKAHLDPPRDGVCKT